MDPKDIKTLRKLKVYLDTSVISHLEPPDQTSEHEYTHMFWKTAKAGKFNLFISEMVLEELNRCEPKKFNLLSKYLSEVKYSLLTLNDQITSLAVIVRERNILPQNNLSDSLHIAYALTAECDYLLTWNMKYLANVYTNDAIHILTLKNRYNPIGLLPPSMLIKANEERNYETKDVRNLYYLTVDDIRRIRDDLYDRHYNPDIMVMINSIAEEAHQGAVKALEKIEQLRKEKGESMDNNS
jgi:predicted nucleic acid-binding protein